MGRNLLIMLIIGAFCVAACGNLHKSSIGMKQVGENTIVEQEVFQQKSKTLARLKELKEKSAGSYLTAKDNTHLVEMRGKEMAQLKKYRLQIEQEAENYISEQKQELEKAYQLKMFNLRIQLDSLKLRTKNREQLENEMVDLRLERELKLSLLDERKQNYILMKMKAYRKAMQERLDT